MAAGTVRNCYAALHEAKTGSEIATKQAETWESGKIKKNENNLNAGDFSFTPGFSQVLENAKSTETV